MNYTEQSPNIDLEITNYPNLNTNIQIPAAVEIFTQTANKPLNYLRLALNFGLVYGAFLFSYFLRFNWLNFDGTSTRVDELDHYLSLGVIYSGIFVVLLALIRKSQFSHKNSFAKAILSLAGIVLTSIVIITLMQVIDSSPLFFSRLVFIFLAPVTWLIMVGEIMVTSALNYWISTGRVGYDIKRTIDLAGTIILLVVVAIPLIIIALAVKLDSKGPVIFKQTRIGKNGKPFTFYKFRSMHTDADIRLAHLMKFNETQGATFKMKNDPRVTRVGRIIRRTSLDELPQLLNILMGQMSLVGPRPGLPREVVNYQEWQYRRLEITPGLTGLWQVSGRSSISFEEMTKLDIYYVDHWSLWLDLKILIMTVKTVVTGKGAY